MYKCRRAVKQKLCYEFFIDFCKQLKAIVRVTVIRKIKCNCNLIVIDINVIEPCLRQPIKCFVYTPLWSVGVTVHDLLLVDTKAADESRRRWVKTSRELGDSVQSDVARARSWVTWQPTTSPFPPRQRREFARYQRCCTAKLSPAINVSSPLLLVRVLARLSVEWSYEPAGVAASAYASATAT